MPVGGGWRPSADLECQVVQLGKDSLIALLGCSGSGKTTFAHRHFARYQVLSSDECRGLVADDENDQSATPDAFEVLYFIAGKRLAQRRLTVIDATNVNVFARSRVVNCAQQYKVECVWPSSSISPSNCAYSEPQAAPIGR